MPVVSLVIIALASWRVADLTRNEILVLRQTWAKWLLISQMVADYSFSVRFHVLNDCTYHTHPAPGNPSPLPSSFIFMFLVNKWAANEWIVRNLVLDNQQPRSLQHAQTHRNKTRVPFRWGVLRIESCIIIIINCPPIWYRQTGRAWRRLAAHLLHTHTHTCNVHAPKHCAIDFKSEIFAIRFDNCTSVVADCFDFVFLVIKITSAELVSRAMLPKINAIAIAKTLPNPMCCCCSIASLACTCAVCAFARLRTL